MKKKKEQKYYQKIKKKFSLGLTHQPSAAAVVFQQDFPAMLP